MRSLLEAFGGGDFARLRVGIGRPQSREETTDYVLGPFDVRESLVLGDYLKLAEDALEAILLSGTSRGMNLFNNKRISV